MKTYIVQVKVARTTYETMDINIQAPNDDAAIDGATDYALMYGAPEGRAVTLTKDRELSARVAIHNADIAPDVVVDEFGKWVNIAKTGEAK